MLGIVTIQYNPLFWNPINQYYKSIWIHLVHRNSPWRSPNNAIRKKHATRHVESAAPALQKLTWRSPKCYACHENGNHLLKTSQKYCARHTERLLTCYETCWDVTKCHACQAKRGYEAFETSKSDHCYSTPHRSPHSRASDGCGRSRTAANTKATSSEHVWTPRPQSKTRALRYAFGNYCNIDTLVWTITSIKRTQYKIKYNI